jgi:hypothetical protein
MLSPLRGILLTFTVTPVKPPYCFVINIDRPTPAESFDYILPGHADLNTCHIDQAIPVRGNIPDSSSLR